MTCVALVEIAGDPRTVRELASRHLTPDEAACCADTATEKRRADFVAGRIAAKAALTQFLSASSPIVEPLAILVARGAASGRPRPVRATDGAPLDVHVSITHSNGIAVAAAAHGRLGIDLAPIAPYTPAFAREAFAPGELAAWSTAFGSETASEFTCAAAFAAKECALKWLGTGLRAPLHSVTVHPATRPVRGRFPGLDGAALTFAAGVRAREAPVDDGAFHRHDVDVTLQVSLKLLRTQVLVLLGTAT